MVLLIHQHPRVADLLQFFFKLLLTYQSSILSRPNYYIFRVFAATGSSSMVSIEGFEPVTVQILSLLPPTNWARLTFRRHCFNGNAQTRWREENYEKSFKALTLPILISRFATSHIPRYHIAVSRILVWVGGSLVLIHVFAVVDYSTNGWESELRYLDLLINSQALFLWANPQYIGRAPRIRT